MSLITFFYFDIKSTTANEKIGLLFELFGRIVVKN